MMHGYRFRHEGPSSVFQDQLYDVSTTRVHGASPQDSFIFARVGKKYE